MHYSFNFSLCLDLLKILDGETLKITHLTDEKTGAQK